MALGTGNYKEFIEEEITRLRKTEADTNKDEIERLRSLNSHKTQRKDGKGKQSRIIIG